MYLISLQMQVTAENFAEKPEGVFVSVSLFQGNGIILIMRKKNSRSCFTTIGKG